VGIAALLIALVALVISLVALSLTLTIYRELIGKAFANRDVERSVPKIATGTNAGEQGFATRVVDAANQSASTPFLSVPDLPPEALAPSLGRPPMPKGGFGTKIVTKRDR
jgi:uncharacterized protein (DUF58 family)